MGDYTAMLNDVEAVLQSSNLVIPVRCQLDMAIKFVLVGLVCAFSRNQKL